MKKAILSIILLLATVRLFGMSDPVLPKKWNKDFTVSISHNSTMSNSSSKVTFTYDSCTYSSSQQGRKPTEKKFALTQADRVKILAQLRAMKVHKIRSGIQIVAQDDGWSTALSFGGHYIDGGSGVKMSTKDKDRFQNAYRFLEDFATNR